MKSALAALALVFVAGCNIVGSTGSPCTVASDCEHGQTCDLTQPGGFCTRGCSASIGECPGGSVCAPLGKSLACVAICTADADCRADYACGSFAAGAAKACLPAQPAR